LNPAYLLVYNLPAGNLILEPFRYALVAFLGVAMLAAAAIHLLPSQKLKLIAAVLVMVDIIAGTPIGFPLPTREYKPIELPESLNSLPSGGFIHLPFFIPKTSLFDRDHFAYQLVHDHPIGDIIMGFPPKLYLDDSLLCTLIQWEENYFPKPVTPCKTLSVNESIYSLREQGFQAIVLEPSKYEVETLKRVTDVLDTALSGQEEGQFIVYRLTRDDDKEIQPAE